MGKKASRLARLIEENKKLREQVRVEENKKLREQVRDLKLLEKRNLMEIRQLKEKAVPGIPNLGGSL